MYNNSKVSIVINCYWLFKLYLSLQINLKYKLRGTDLTYYNNYLTCKASVVIVIVDKHSHRFDMLLMSNLYS